MSEAACKTAALRPSPDVVAKRLGSVAILVDVQTNRIFELNETGTRVWELLDQGLDPDRIVRHLANEFDVDDVSATDEVKTLVAQLQAEGLLAS